MEPAKPSNKFKIAFFTTLVTTIVFLVAAAALGYVYYTKSQAYNDLNSANNKCKKEKAALEKQASSSSATLNQKLKTCEDQKKAALDTNKNKTDKVAAYNTLFSYFITVLRTHSGLNGWTDAEYQKARGLAQATEDQHMEDKNDWAWNHHA